MKLRQCLRPTVLATATVCATFAAIIWLAIDPPSSWDYRSRYDEFHAPLPRTSTVFWGSDTNGLKAGLSMGYYSGQSFQYFTRRSDAIPIRCFLVMDYNGTNFGHGFKDVLILDLPQKPCYQLDLQDAQGRAVQKTAKGKELSNIVPEYYKLSPNPSTGSIVDMGHRPHRQHVPNDGFSSPLTEPFILQDYFAITNAGKYKLNFRLCVFVPRGDSSGTEDLFWLPVVQCDIDIGEFRSSGDE